MASVPNSNPPATPEPNTLKFNPVFITDNPAKSSEKTLCAEGESPGLYPALARQLRRAQLAGPCCAKCILLVIHLWANGTVNSFPTHLSCRCDVCAAPAFARQRCSTVWWALAQPHTCISWRALLWECRWMVLYLCHRRADSSVSPAVTRGATADSSMGLALLLPLSSCFEAELDLCHCMPSIYHLACLKSCHSCLWLTSFSYQREIVSEGPPLSSVSASGWVCGHEKIRLLFFSHCAHCGYSSKGWGCFCEFIRM